MASERPPEPRDIAREAARFAREAARAARDEAREEARRISREASRVGRHARRHGPGVDSFDLPSDGASVSGTLDVEGVGHIVIKQTAGRLTVRPCRDGETPGVETSASKSPPDLTVNREGDRLLVEIRLSVGRLFRRRRGADTLVRLSPGFSRLDIDMGHGHLVVGEVGCDRLDVDIGAGDVSLLGVRADTTVDVGAGHVVAERHAGLIQCDCGTGDVRLEVVEARDGVYSIDVGIGQAELVLPPGLKVGHTISSGLGKSETTYPNAGEGAPITANVNAGIGRAAITAGRGSADQGSKPEAPVRRPAASRRTESEEVRVLQLLEQGRITAQEAADLIAALQGVERPREETADD